MSRVRLEKELEKQMNKRSKTNNSNDNQTNMEPETISLVQKAKKEVLSDEFCHGATRKQP